MCMFCAAIPVTISLGAAAKAKQSEQRKQAEASGEPVPQWVIPVVKVTGVVVGSLVVSAVVYHTAIAPRIGIW
jgi:hypothetical protein